MTWAEFQALKEIYDANLNRWALERAMYANVHFRQVDEHGKFSDVPFEPADFLGTGNRAQRQAQSIADKVELMRLNMRLSQIQPGAPPGDDIPEWARGGH